MCSIKPGLFSVALQLISWKLRTATGILSDVTDTCQTAVNAPSPEEWPPRLSQHTLKLC